MKKVLICSCLISAVSFARLKENTNAKCERFSHLAKANPVRLRQQLFLGVQPAVAKRINWTIFRASIPTQAITPETLLENSDARGVGLFLAPYHNDNADLLGLPVITTRLTTIAWLYTQEHYKLEGSYKFTTTQTGTVEEYGSIKPRAKHLVEALVAAIEAECR